MLKTIPELVAEASDGLRCISAEEAFRECGGNSGHVIDVREPGEVDLHPVSGSLHIPRGVLEMKVLELSQDPQTPIYIHCASGVRARLAAAQLMHMGFTQVAAISCNIEQVKAACDNQSAAAKG
ncbi:rhodanese-like domain-containing protein [Halieaceae bacterium IMCC14734]|uniref:Rhodanese-like domain-containing protein n=1 Tax=Candidatus Litorirhabdus singularis TaxID=2518993 RepID=A0ABT3TE40_9GAMM|nr:rhodanese-like domain-containing protein [Candidatus Litorirhabdus singularis]MCX2979697.1 rhodanese-like domain-containing protein [Candidatus Litorirhabdus singularis]